MWSVPPTDFDLATVVRKDYIAVRVRAIAIGTDIAERFLREIRLSLAQHRLGNALLEFEIAHTLTDKEVFDVMRTFSTVMPGLKIAVVNRDPRHHPSVEFGVHASQKFGQDLAYFTDPRVAEQWLTSGS
jgi:hypothetical protein